MFYVFFNDGNYGHCFYSDINKFLLYQNCISFIEIRFEADELTNIYSLKALLRHFISNIFLASFFCYLVKCILQILGNFIDVFVKNP